MCINRQCGDAVCDVYLHADGGGAAVSQLHGHVHGVGIVLSVRADAGVLVGCGLLVLGIAAGIHSHLAEAAGVGSRYHGHALRQTAHRYIVGGMGCHTCVGRVGIGRDLGEISGVYLGGGAGGSRVTVAVGGCEGELVVRSLAGGGYAIVAEVTIGAVQGQGMAAAHIKGVVAIGALCAGHF